jgi:hypothetical protein
MTHDADFGTLHILVDRKISPTQPGRGIRKIIDLYHDLAILLDKASKHSNPEGIEEADQIDVVGRTEEDIEEERKEYASLSMRCVTY